MITRFSSFKWTTDINRTQWNIMNNYFDFFVRKRHQQTFSRFPVGHNQIRKFQFFFFLFIISKLVLKYLRRIWTKTPSTYSKVFSSRRRPVLISSSNAGPKLSNSYETWAIFIISYSIYNYYRNLKVKKNSQLMLCSLESYIIFPYNNH